MRVDTSRLRRGVRVVLSACERGFESAPFPAALLAAVILASIVGFGSALSGSFLSDDFAYIGRFAAMPSSAWLSLFVRDWSGGIWGYPLPELRPLVGLSLAIDARLWGTWAWGYHLTNLAIHIGCAWLVGAIAWRVSGTRFCALTAALLFAVYPVHTEAIVWITGRVDLIFTFFYLCAILAWFTYRMNGGRVALVSAWLSFALAAYSKEAGLTVPVMAALGDILFVRQRAKQNLKQICAPYAGWIVIAVIYAVCRRAALGPALFSATRDSGMNFTGDLIAHQRAYLRSLFLDSGLRPFVGASRSWRNWALVLMSIAILTWLSLRARRLAASLFFGPVWYLLATVPLIVTYLSARHLYLASVGICIAWAIGLEALPRRVGASLAAILITSFLLTLPAAERPWRDAAAISRAATLAVQQADQRAPAGAALVIDVPVTLDTVWLWAWASPFALKPPFQDHDLSRSRVILEAPRTYFRLQEWLDPKRFAQLADANGAMIVQSTDDGMRSWWCPSGRLQPAAARLANDLTGEMDERTIDAAWKRFMNDVAERQ